MAMCHLTETEGVLHEVCELLAQGVNDVLGGSKRECPDVATPVERIYELEDARRVDDAGVVGVGVAPPHTQLCKNVAVDELRVAVCPSRMRYPYALPVCVTRPHPPRRPAVK